MAGSRKEQEAVDPAARVPEKTYAGMTRRTLCMGVGAAAVMLGIGGVGAVSAQSIVRPPGGQDEERLWGSCIRCEKCYEVCPRSVIVPAALEQGLMNARTPTLTLNGNWCDWCAEENGGVPLCVESCPTQALSLPADATAENTVLGIAVLNEDLCLAYRLTGCRFCYDACEYEAMGLNEIGQPFVLNDICNGCGACQSVCVSLESGSVAGGIDVRAITVQPVSAVEGR